MIINQLQRKNQELQKCPQELKKVNQEDTCKIYRKIELQSLQAYKSCVCICRCTDTEG